MTERAQRLGARALTVLFLALAAYYFIAGGEYGAFAHRELRVERQRTERRIESLHAELDSIRIWSDSLANSPIATERVARERYGFIRDGERMYRFVAPEAPEKDSTGGPLPAVAREDR